MRKVLFCFVCLFMGMAVYAQNDVRLIRNATLKIQYAGKTILLDPMLGEKGTEMSALGVNLNPRVHLTMPVSEVLKGVDFVLLTHAHIDHYDPAAETMQIIDDCPVNTRFIDVHMDAIDHCQTTRAILRNEARHHGTDMSRLIIPEDGESITLK